MLCLIQNLLKITIFSVVVDRKRNEKILCVWGIKLFNLASILGGNGGKNFECSVSKTGRQRTDCHQIGSYAISCSFRKTGECLGACILETVSDLQKKKQTSNSRKISDAPPSLECWHCVIFALPPSLCIRTYIFFLSLLRLNYRCDPKQKMTLRKCSHLINRHLDFTNHPWSRSRISHHL